VWFFGDISTELLALCIYLVYTLIMETSIQKWGNSLGVRLPKNIALNQSLKEGSRVVVTETKTGIAIEAVKKTRKYTLAELLKGTTKDKLHKETDWGGPVGNEIW
jgi:antitoxin MazE